MNLIVTIDHRFDRTPDGAVWTTASFTYSFWKRYLEVFDRVRIVARVQDVASVSPDRTRSDGERVSFTAVPYYVGPWQYLQRARRVRRAARNAIDAKRAVIIRTSSQIANCVEGLLFQTGHPYGAEVVGDPYDFFAPGSVKHPLRPFLRWWFPHKLRRQCAGACAVAYVTGQALQRRYPPAPTALSTYYSDVQLPAAAWVSAPRPPRPDQRTFNLIIVGTLAQLYKAPDLLIDAVGACVRDGLDLRLVLVGDGKHRQELEAQATALGLNSHVRFTGQLPAGQAVRDQLDRADLFVLPSHQEGLPRAMIEAMARALPCIGSAVGGIPELLSSEDLVSPGDIAALARKIREVVTDPARLARMSARNLDKAQAYREEALRARRVAFYRYVRERTEAWLAQHAS
jgi:glycosyltransferase involved in cell wall biosynthesis